LIKREESKASEQRGFKTGQWSEITRDQILCQTGTDRDGMWVLIGIVSVVVDVR
jgi:hypothetical protein